MVKPDSTRSMHWHNVDACDLCGGESFRPYAEIPSQHPETGAVRWYDGRPIELAECQSCGLVCVSPRPDLRELYEGYIAGSSNAADAVKRKRERKNVGEIHRKHIETAIGYLGRPAARLFDMGCGAGTTLLEARKLGLDAEGNEINKASVDLLTSEGFKAYHGFTQDLDLPLASFDIVINFDYLEHSYTPLEDLRTCHKLLNPGGVLYLKTLYLGCPAHVEKGNNWQLFGPGHFHFFTPTVLRKMVETAGFEILDVKAGQLIFVAARRAA